MYSIWYHNGIEWVLRDVIRGNANARARVAEIRKAGSNAVMLPYLGQDDCMMRNGEKPTAISE